MAVSREKSMKKRPSAKINKVGVTSDILTSRGGLSLHAKYLENSNVLSCLGVLFGAIRKSNKGLEIEKIFKQVICFLMDGTSRHLTYFDYLKKDQGYAASLELTSDEMLSSHSVKRFFKAFSMPMIWGFRKLMNQLFLWRLRLKGSQVIILGIDSMVMDNDEAVKRHGVQPTYKKIKGFHPLQLTWERFIVDAVFRGGKKHCNHGNTVANMVRRVVKLLRTNYRNDVAIVILLDSGFFDEKLFKVFEELEIGYICSGKIYNDLNTYAENIDTNHWGKYSKGKQGWEYYEIGDKRQSWSKFRRAIFCLFTPEDPQQTFDAFRPLTILYTNLGMGESIDQRLQQLGREDLLQVEKIIECAHGRGRDELVHRALKDYAFEELPFKCFAPNAAFYYTMVVSHFLYECFKEDTCQDIVPLKAYATTFRRTVMDIAAKIVRTGGEIWIKFSQVAWDTLNLEKLWERCNHPPQFAFV